MGNRRGCIALTKCPRTEALAETVTRLLQDRGWQVIPFVADGSGGRALETAIQAGEFEAVVELSLAELAGEALKTGFGAGRDRLTAAGLAGLPQIVVLAGLDAAQVAGLIGDRPKLTIEGREHIRVTPAESDRLGQEIAFKLSAALGPTAILAPAAESATITALVQSVKNWLSPAVLFTQTAFAVNSESLAEEVVSTLGRLISSSVPSSSHR